jgi:hypothetical protein
MTNLICFAVLIASCVSFAGVNPATQAVNTWQLQYHKAALGDVTHPYENCFVWDTRNSIGVVFAGHLGTYNGMDAVSDQVAQIMNTNMTFCFSFTDFQFTKAFPMERPPKRCGVKCVYDELTGNTLAVSGGYHNYKNTYLEPNIRFSALATDGEVPTGDMPYPTGIWAFDGSTRQWHAMRPLIIEGLPVGQVIYSGYYFRMVHAREYGLNMVVPPSTGMMYAYSMYSNQWSLFRKNPANTTLPPEGINRPCATYDTRHKKLVLYYGNASTENNTWAYDVGTQTWSNLGLSNYPTKGPSTSLWGMHSAMAYDRRNGVIVYIKNDGAETWALNLDSTSWSKLSPAGAPPSGPTGGDGMEYDPVNNVCVTYTVTNDEVWSYKYGSNAATRPEPPANTSGITDASGIAITWAAPVSGPAPVKYYIYRAQWGNNKTAYSGTVPGPYVKIDSVAGLTFTDANSALLKIDTVFHSYYISSVSAQGLESDPSTPVFSMLSVPMGLTATPLSRTQAVLRWKPKTEPDIAGYNLYRYKAGYPRHNQMKTGKLNTGLITGTTLYIDNSVNLYASVGYNPLAGEMDSTVMYVVTAVNALGKESGFSPYAVTQPDWVNNIWVDTLHKTLTWSPPRNGNISSYKIYSGAPGTWTGVGGSDPVQIAVSADTFWSYAGQSPSAYKVRAVNSIAQNGFWSDVMAIKWKDTDDSGFFRVDYMTEKPAVDSFYKDLPAVSIDEDGVVVPRESTLEAFPNPFNPSVVVRISGPQKTASPVSVIIYDAAGKKVADLSKGLKKDAPYSRSVSWDGARSASGTYLVEVVAGNRKLHRKIVLLK